MSRVLVIEDEKDIQDLLLLHLKREGLEVEAVSDGQAAWDLLQKKPFDLALVDWMLPGEVSGLELTRLLRAQPRYRPLAVLMLTARASDSDVIAGLEMGADDYVTKPFEIPVLMARVRALLRRVQELASSQALSAEVFELDGLKLSTVTHEVALHGRRLELTPYEFKLLLCLIKNAGRVLTRDALIQEVQGSGVKVIDRAIDTHIFGLRKKLGKEFDHIEAIRGVGYRIAIPGKT
ncbi:DNA-binding response regulator [bacterium]|nr:DNA-binding response regulator [bacterium]